jgi:uncharacterized protein (TIGR02145 family)
LSTSDNPGHKSFIAPAADPHDWRSDNNNTRWQSASSATNPCPYGFRVPTEAEMKAEMDAYKIINGSSNLASYHKFPFAGFRAADTGTPSNEGVGGYYWTSTITNTYARYYYLDNNQVNAYSGRRSIGFPVRCIKN